VRVGRQAPTRVLAVERARAPGDGHHPACSARSPPPPPGGGAARPRRRLIVATQSGTDAPVPYSPTLEDAFHARRPGRRIKNPAGPTAGAPSRPRLSPAVKPASSPSATHSSPLRAHRPVDARVVIGATSTVTNSFAVDDPPPNREVARRDRRRGCRRRTPSNRAATRPAKRARNGWAAHPPRRAQPGKSCGAPVFDGSYGAQDESGAADDASEDGKPACRFAR